MFELIFIDILAAFQRYMIYAITAGIIAITVVFVLLFFASEEKIAKVWERYRPKLVLFFIVIVYLFGVVAVTILSREPGSREGVDLELFSTFSLSWIENVYPIENIILFIPLGFLLPFLWKKLNHITSCSLSGLLISLAIELSQLVTKRGFFQIDDMLTNTVGCVIGFGIGTICQVVYNSFLRFTNNRNEKPGIT